MVPATSNGNEEHRRLESYFDDALEQYRKDNSGMPTVAEVIGALECIKLQTYMAHAMAGIGGRE